MSPGLYVFVVKLKTAVCFYQVCFLRYIACKCLGQNVTCNGQVTSAICSLENVCYHTATWTVLLNAQRVSIYHSFNTNVSEAKQFYLNWFILFGWTTNVLLRQLLSHNLSICQTNLSFWLRKQLQLLFNLCLALCLLLPIQLWQLAWQMRQGVSYYYSGLNELLIALTVLLIKRNLTIIQACSFLCIMVHRNR